MLPAVVHAARRTLLAIPSSCHRNDCKLNSNGLEAVVEVVLPDTVPNVLTKVVLTINEVMNRATTLVCACNSTANCTTNPLGSKQSLTIRVCMLAGRKLRASRT